MYRSFVDELERKEIIHTRLDVGYYEGTTSSANRHAITTNRIPIAQFRFTTVAGIDSEHWCAAGS